jgi:hypothetical protein
MNSFLDRTLGALGPAKWTPTHGPLNDDRGIAAVIRATHCGEVAHKRMSIHGKRIRQQTMESGRQGPCGILLGGRPLDSWVVLRYEVAVAAPGGVNSENSDSTSPLLTRMVESISFTACL